MPTPSAPIQRIAKSSPEHQIRPGIFRIVLTGGPCGGKSTGLVYLERKLEQLGYATFRVEEAASRVAALGFDLRDRTTEGGRKVQVKIIETQMALEDEAILAAEKLGRPAVILIDRGTVDSFGYAAESDKVWLLEHFGAKTTDWLARYDVVLHFQTAALGASSSYSLANNPARSESAAEAVKVDTMLRNAWAEHPRQRVVVSCASFEEKMSHAMQDSVEGIDAVAEIRERASQMTVVATSDTARTPSGSSGSKKALVPALPDLGEGLLRAA